MKTKWIPLIAFLAFAHNSPAVVPSDSDATIQARIRLQPVFAAAALKYQVPVRVLQAIAYNESRWIQRIPEPTDGEPDMPTAYGVMGLRNDVFFGHSLVIAA